MGAFICNILIFIILTVTVGSITVIERKVLAVLQRRVGPNYIGSKGRFQFIADAIKLLSKHIVILITINKFIFIATPSLILTLCFLTWANLIWGPYLQLFEIEYNLIFMAILSILFSTLLFITAINVRNKYALMSAYRVLITTLNLEVFINFLIIFILLVFESFSFQHIITFQNNLICGVFLLLPLLPFFIITFFLEVSRIPFDVTEAESELIAGYTTEFGGFFFVLFYLSEYFHLFCFSVIYVTLFFSF